VLTWPLMVAVQIDQRTHRRVTGRGPIAGNMVLVFPRRRSSALWCCCCSSPIPSNLGADLAAMGAAAKLMIGIGSPHLYTFGFAVFSLLAVVSSPTIATSGLLKWFTFSLLAYVGVVFTVEDRLARPWWPAPSCPKFELSGDSLTLVVAIFGTTISPYLFFWQSSQEVEDEEADPDAGPLIDRPEQANRELQSHRLGNLGRHGDLQRHRLLHHADHGRDPCTWRARPISRPPSRRPRR